MAEISSLFVNAMRAELIERVCSVMSLADRLFQEKCITSEMYANITAARTNQDKMREIFRCLNNSYSKEFFYEALKNQDPFLFEELEEEFRNPGVVADSNMGKPRGSSTNSASGPQFLWQVQTGQVPAQPEEQSSQSGPSSMGSRSVDDGTRTRLKERWNKISNEHRTKFEKLLEDPELKQVGNGKVFLCAKSEYEIGTGAAGTRVYIGMRDEGTEVAVKRILKDYHKELENEMRMLRDLEHKNIVRYLDFTEDREYNYLCLQLCEFNFDKYKEKTTLDADALKKVAREVLLGLQALHDVGIIHRDIKPSNILIDVEGNVRLTDFGISRMLNQDASTVHTSRAGTRGWEAAEILNADGRCEYKRSADIQVAGMLVHYILSGGNHPFGTHYKREVNIVEGNSALDEITDVEAKDLIENMIAHKPDARLRATDAVGHPYFWDSDRREIFLRTIGDMKDIQKYDKPHDELSKAVEKYEAFKGWKSKEASEGPIDKKLPDNLLGLLRFQRNRLVHGRSTFLDMYKNTYPEFFIRANQLAKDMGWNKKPGAEKSF